MLNSTQQHVTTNISLINKQKISRQALTKRSDLISITHLERCVF
jgi:hypothetical protein